MDDMDWRRFAAEDPIRWRGDPEDDCVCYWAGLLLRAEQMDEDSWWWAVYDGDKQVNSSDNEPFSHRPEPCRSGEQARAAAERAARRWLGLMER
ncbi:MAG: hypothetical protein AAGI68_06015 [Planctomycetota bacterium]